MLTRGKLARAKLDADKPLQVKPPDRPRQVKPPDKIMPPKAPAGLGNFGLLPPELRNRIYNYFLLEPESVKLQSYQPRGELHYVINGKPMSRVVGQEVAPIDHKRKTERRGQELVGKDTWIEIPSKTALSQVNKQMRAEACSILYGSNSFEFTNVKALQRFLTQIGDNKKYLRAVGLRWSRRGANPELLHGRRVFRDLIVAKSLHTLSICEFPLNDDPVYKARYIRRHVWMCLPLLRSLHKTLKANNSSTSVLDMLKIDHHVPAFRPHHSPYDCNDWCALRCAEHDDRLFGCCTLNMMDYQHCKKNTAQFLERGEELTVALKTEAARQLGIVYP